MNRLLFCIITFLSLICFTQIRSQDLHFSQYINSPINLNPALTGFTQGNLRFNANYRNQWFALNSFSTYAFSADANILRSQLDYQMLGVGLSFYQDIEESNGLSNTNFALSTAFNLKISERPLQYIGIGFQTGILRKQINLSDEIYGSFYETGNNFDPLENSQFNSFNLDLGLGISYYSHIDQRHAILLGLSLFHLNQPNQAILGRDIVDLKYSGFFNAHLELNYNSTVWLQPSMLFNKQGSSTEFNAGLGVRYRFYNAINDVFLSFGLALRAVGHESLKLSFADIIFNTQFNFEQFYLGFSYDVSISGVKLATSRNGGPEISLSANLDFEGRQPRYFKLVY